ncbi:MAG: HEPN domain-containing protein [Candidatus Woesearchaeota archaeon]
MDAFRDTGKFFLPESNHIVDGIITFNDAEGIKIELMNFLDPNSADGKYYPVVFGKLHDSGKITLFDVLETSLNINNILDQGTVSKKSKLVSHTLFVGSFFNTNEEVNGHSISLKLKNLDEWISISGFKHTHAEDNTTIISYKHPEIITCKIDSINKKISFITNFHESVNRTNVNLSQSVSMKIESLDGSKINYFNSQNDIKKIINFFSLLMGKNTYITQLELRENIQNSIIPHIAKVYFKPVFSREKDDMNVFDMIIPYGEISENFEACINKWFEIYSEIEHAYDTFFGSIANYHLYPFNIFLIRIHAIEAYHRMRIKTTERSTEEFLAYLKTIHDSLSGHKKISDWIDGKLKYANDKGLKQKLLEILNTENSLFKEYINNFEDFATVVSNTRNYYAHFDPVLKDKSLSEKDMIKYNHILKMIIEVIIIKELSLDREIIKKLARKYSYVKIGF